MNFDPRIRLGWPVGRRFLLEWLCIGCLGVAIILLSSLGRLTAGADHLVYDWFLRLRAHPVLPDIVVVEIDNDSIARLGRWPWPRTVHARLLDEIAQAAPAAVVYDVLFTEPAEGDAQLAHAIAARPTWLPILLSPEDARGKPLAVRPVEPLAGAAAGLGHINLEVDGDGIVRSVALYEADAHNRWPQLMLPVWRAMEESATKQADNAGIASVPRDAGLPGGDGEKRFLIPFSPLAQDYQKVSFASVLAGDVPRDVLGGKIVLIGVTASGLYDRFSTPVSGQLGPLSGVYIHANILDALLTGRAIEPANTPMVLAVSLVPLAVLLAGFLVLSPLRSLLMTIALGLAMLGGSAVLLYGARFWMSPVSAIAGLIVVYPIWNWRRLEMTMAYLRKELQRLANEPYLFPEAPKGRGFGGDVLAQQMDLMAQAAQRMRDMKRFIWNSLDGVPGPVLVSDMSGVVLIANHAAKAHVEWLGGAEPEGRRINEVLGNLVFVKVIGSEAQSDSPASAHWPAMLDPGRHEFATVMERGSEVRDRTGRDYLLRYARCANAQGGEMCWITGLVDVTALHAAERLREEALSLLSHDMRSPQASILALVEIERARTLEPERMQELLGRIERYAQRSLSLADDFVQLARAESQAYVLEPVSLTELVIDASDEVWPQAQARQIRLEAEYAEKGGGNGYWINADRSLMTRALVNILNNAVKYSASGTRVTCLVARENRSADGVPPRILCIVSDEGYGISAEDQIHLFERFQRFHKAERPDIPGTGLGMAFVKAVVTRHGGIVQVESARGKGTVFTISLPALDEAVI